MQGAEMAVLLGQMSWVLGWDGKSFGHQALLNSSRPKWPSIHLASIYAKRLSIQRARHMTSRGFRPGLPPILEFGSMVKRPENHIWNSKYISTETEWLAKICSQDGLYFGAWNVLNFQLKWPSFGYQIYLEIVGELCLEAKYFRFTSVCHFAPLLALFNIAFVAVHATSLLWNAPFFDLNSF